MLAQNLIPITLEANITEEDEIPQRRPHLIYKNLLRKISTSPLFKRLVLLQSRSQALTQGSSHGKTITTKMRTKVINWLQKLSMETFQFSLETLLMAVKILDEYLCMTAESPNVLQLIGCACLYLAAKTREVTIVAGQCYVLASAGCFTEEQLMQKQLEVFRTLNYNTTFSSLPRVYKLIEQSSQSGLMKGYGKGEVERRLAEMGKSWELREWKEHRVACMFVALGQAKNQLPQVSDLVAMLKLHSAF